MSKQDLAASIPSYQTFKQLIGQSIAVEDTQGNTLELSLDEVATSSAHSPSYDSFSAYLNDTLPNRVPQGCYTFSHPDIGRQWLFCSAKSPTQYEIVINRKTTDDT